MHLVELENSFLVRLSGPKPCAFHCCFRTQFHSHQSTARKVQNEKLFEIRETSSLTVDSDFKIVITSDVDMVCSPTSTSASVSVCLCFLVTFSGDVVC